MARISDYGNYETDKTQAEVEKFKETGVLPVSGKYTDNGTMTTKNVKLSDLVSGGGSGGLSLVTVAAVYNNNDITITVPSNNTFVRVTGIDVTSDYGKGPSTVHIVVPSTGAGEYLNFIVNLTTVDGQGAVQGIGNDDHEIVFDNASLGNLSIAEAYYIYGNAPTLIIVRDNTYNICNKYNGFQ